MPGQPTQKQKEILDYIESYTHQHGKRPSMSQIGRNFGMANHNSVRSHLIALHKKGLIDGADYGNSIPPDTEARTVRIPFLTSRNGEGGERVACDFIWLDGTLFPEYQELFAIKVEGDRMTDAGIHHGDIAVARRWPGPPNGKVVVLNYQGKIFLQRLLRQQKGYYTFRSEHPGYQELKIKAGNDFIIEGVIVSLLRPSF